MRKLYVILMLVVGLLAHHLLIFLHETPTTIHAFHNYEHENPVAWSPDYKMCIQIIPKTVSSANASVVLDALREFYDVTGIESSIKCETTNISMTFLPRSALSYLGSNEGVGAATFRQSEVSKREIIGGDIQIDSKFFDNSSFKVKKRLIAHELGHVAGLAHSEEPGLMYPIILSSNPFSISMEAQREFLKRKLQGSRQ